MHRFDISKKGSSPFGRSNAISALGMKLPHQEICVVVYIRSLVPRTPLGPAGRKDNP